jgi:hypothetical protein
MKKRLLVAMLVAVTSALGVAGPAAAAECEYEELPPRREESIPLQINLPVLERSDANAAIPIAGGGSFKVGALEVFHNVGVELPVTFSSNFPHNGPPVICKEVFLGPAEHVTLVFVRGVVRPGR